MLCRSSLSSREWLAGLLIFAWFALLAWILDSYLSGRAAYIHVGASIGTIMVANVFRVIIPAQKDLVNAVTEERSPDPSKGLEALQRSRHNNYLTLPVLFIMISSHYPVTYGHQDNWLILLVFSLAAVSIRHYFNIRHLPGHRFWPLIPAVLLLIGLIVATAPKAPTVSPQGDSSRAVDINTAFAIIQQRCTTCHSQKPTFAGFATAPLWVELDTQDKLILQAGRVYQSVVITRTMPLANLSKITDKEREIIARWYGGLSETKSGSQ